MAAATTSTTSRLRYITPTAWCAFACLSSSVSALQGTPRAAGPEPDHASPSRPARPGARGPWPRSRARRRPRPPRCSRCPAPRRRCCSPGEPPPCAARGCARGARPRWRAGAGSSPPPPRHGACSVASPAGRSLPRRRSPRSRYGWICAPDRGWVIALVTLVVTRDVCVYEQVVVRVLGFCGLWTAQFYYLSTKSSGFCGSWILRFSQRYHRRLHGSMAYDFEDWFCRLTGIETSCTIVDCAERLVKAGTVAQAGS